MNRLDPKRQLVTVEGNLEDLPFATLNSSSPGMRRIEHSWSDRWSSRKGDGTEVRRKWAIEGSERYGLPGPVEQDIYVALLVIVASRGGMPEDGRVSFSLYDLLKIMGSSRGGKDYSRVRRGLRTIARSTIESQRAFYSPISEVYVSDEFSLFSLHFSEALDRRSDRFEDRHSLVFHPYFVESYGNNYDGRINAEFYWSLQKPTSKRLYRLLDRRAVEKRDGGSRVLELDLSDLQSSMPLVGRPSNVRKILSGAEVELRRAGFIDRVEYADLRRGSKRGAILVTYTLSKTFSQRSFSKKIDLSVAESSAVDQMTYWGVSRSRATEEVLKRGAEYCERWAVMAHFQKNVEPGRSGGLLIKALDEQYWWWPRNMERATGSGAGASHGPEGRATVDDVLVWPAEQEQEVKSSLFLGDGDASSDMLAEADAKATIVWARVLEDLADEVNVSSLRVWFEATFATGLKDNTLTVSVPNEFAEEYISSRFGEAIAQSASRHQGGKVCLKLESRS